MNIILLGTGRMGNAIESVARQRGHDIRARFDIDSPLESDSDLGGGEVMIDFTTADQAMRHMHIAAENHVPIVQGTTGWEMKLSELERLPSLSCVISPNFSPGVYLFKKMAGIAASLLRNVSDYDPYIREMHHRGKADSPSGTARWLSQTILSEWPGMTGAVEGHPEGRVPKDKLHVTSIRSGRIPGEHEVGFDSSYDTLTMIHRAHGREGFAYGAVRAAEWIVGKTGIYTMDDLMADLIQEDTPDPA